MLLQSVIAAFASCGNFDWSFARLVAPVVCWNENLLIAVVSNTFYKYLRTLSYLQRKNNELDDEMLTLTAELLSSIPEFSTLWNIRRELIEDWAASWFVHNFSINRKLVTLHAIFSCSATAKCNMRCVTLCL